MRGTARVYFWIMTAVFLLCLFVFGNTLIIDARGDEYELFEQIGRVLGYIFALSAAVVCAVGARRGGGEGALRLSMAIAYAAMLILLVHDVLLYNEYGNDIGGLLTMTAYFALDAGLIALQTAALFLRRRGSRALRPAAAAVALLWLAYAVGDMLGYPAAAISDWDESLMKLALALAAAYPLFLN